MAPRAADFRRHRKHIPDHGAVKRALPRHPAILEGEDAAGIAAGQGQIVQRRDHGMTALGQSASRAMAAKAWTGSRPVTGSSTIRISGRPTMARASMARENSPPDRVVTG